MDTATLLGLLAAAVAILAALYARWTALSSARQALAAEDAVRHAANQVAIAREAVAQAKAQNRIAIHNEGLRIYKAFLAFRSKVTAHGSAFKDDDFRAWHEHANLAPFYLSESVANESGALVDLAWKILNMREQWDVGGFRNDELVRLTHECLRQWRVNSDAFEENIRAELRVSANL